MEKTNRISKRLTIVLVYFRPVFVFIGLICAIGVMLQKSHLLYTIGVLFLLLSMTFDLVDGWLAARFIPNSKMAVLADRIMDKIVFSIIFPVVAVGEMWRLFMTSPDYTRQELFHVIFVLILCVVVLVRDNFAHFMRGFAVRAGHEPEFTEFARLRTMFAAPVAAVLYAHAFYIPADPALGIYAGIYGMISKVGTFPLVVLFFVEILLFVFCMGSIAMYCKRYGTLCLDELCLGDIKLRRRILSIFPNALTMMNAMMGLLAVFFVYQGRVKEAYLILIGAAFFDKLDGTLARRLGLNEPLPDDDVNKPKTNITLGGILDDIADGVSFCIAPAWIFYIVMSGLGDSIGAKLPVLWISLLYLAAGITRLIYFTIDKTPVPGFFKGLPTPAAALFVTAPLILLNQSIDGGFGTVRFWAIFSAGVYLYTSIMMNMYPLKYLHIGRLMSREPWFARAMLLVIILTVFTPYFGVTAFLLLFLYLLSPMFTWRIDTEIAAKESKEIKA